MAFPHCFLHHLLRGLSVSISGAVEFPMNTEKKFIHVMHAHLYVSLPYKLMYSLCYLRRFCSSSSRNKTRKIAICQSGLHFRGELVTGIVSARICYGLVCVLKCSVRCGQSSWAQQAQNSDWVNWRTWPEHWKCAWFLVQYCISGGITMAFIYELLT